MGKDRSGHFHTIKGKPSGSYKEDGKDGYTSDMNVRHRNRNSNKDEGDYVENTGISGSYKSRLHAGPVNGSTKVHDLGATLDRTTYLELASMYSPNSVSIYLPTHHSGREVNEHEDFIQFRNSLQEAEALMNKAGVDKETRDKSLSAADALLADTSFWTNQNHGLAVFISEDNCYFLKMSSAPLPQVHVGNTFMTAPLLEYLNDNKYFYLLVLSKKHAQLHRVTRETIQQIELPDMPDGVGDVKHFEEMDSKKLTSSSRGGSTHVDYNGSGSGFTNEKDNIAVYMREVNNTIIADVLHTENAPLLLGGVEYLLPIFRSVSNYGNIAEPLLSGNLEHETGTSLHTKAMQLMKPYFEAPLEKSLTMYANLSAGGRTSSIVEDVVPAAYYGKVEHLFVRRGDHIWGSFDPEKNELTVHANQETGDECLLDKAATATIDMGGQVHFIGGEKMPAASSIAAIMRYDETAESNPGAK